MWWYLQLVLKTCNMLDEDMHTSHMPSHKKDTLSFKSLGTSFGKLKTFKNCYCPFTFIIWNLCDETLQLITIQKTAEMYDDSSYPHRQSNKLM